MQVGTKHRPSVTPSGEAPTLNIVTVELTAKDKAFDKRSITVPAGARVFIKFHNLDMITPHNFSLYTDPTARNQLFRGEVVLFRKRITYELIAPSRPGRYYFRCDLHPTMEGDFIVQ